MQEQHPEYEKAMDLLFRARWNIPQASNALGMVNTESSWEAVKIIFRDYCIARERTFKLDDESTW